MFTEWIWFRKDTMGTKERRMRERNDRVKQIQEAAKLLFFKKGYQGSTIEEIAKLAELSKGTIYLYFKNKDDLYVSLMLSGIERFHLRLIDFEKQVSLGKFKNSLEFIMGFYEVHLEHYRDNSGGLRIFQTFQLGNLFLLLSKEDYGRISAGGQENFAISRRIISRAIEMGIIPKVKPVQLCDIIWSIFLGNVQLAESKLVFTKKNHLMDNLKLSFSLIAEGIKALEPNFFEIPQKEQIPESFNPVNAGSYGSLFLQE
jgi:AcrR family transcriptional regulator